MKVKVLLFAHLKEIAGTEYVELDLPEKAKGGDIIEGLAALYPDMAAQKAALKLSMDGDYISLEDPVQADAEIAVLSPVSGG